jgi:hypothetical protein
MVWAQGVGDWGVVGLVSVAAARGAGKAHREIIRGEFVECSTDFADFQERGFGFVRIVFQWSMGVFFGT